MKMVLGIFVVILLGCTSTPAPPPLAGVWEIIAIEQKDEQGKWREADWMKGGTGYLHYDNDHTMSLHFAPNGYDTLRVPEEDNKQLWDMPVLAGLASDYWYLASYKIIGNDSVQHTRILHSDPADRGITVTRIFDLSGDTLQLSAPEHGLRLKWLRMN